MIQSRKFVAAAILVGIALIIAGLLIAPFNASARAAASASGTAADRIGSPLAAAATADVPKGDLCISAECAGAVWPNIDAACLSKADGSAAPRVRTITIGYQTDENTTVLVRVPAEGTAKR
jgi:hypothetical protein